MRSCDCFLSVFISLLFGFKGSLKPEPVKMLSFDCYLKQKLKKKKKVVSWAAGEGVLPAGQGK